MTRTALRTFALAGVAAALLAACATPPAPPRSAGELVATGRVAVKLPSENNLANFSWRDDGKQAQLDLSSPLGNTVAELTFDGKTARLRDQAGKETVAATPDDLLKARTGWELPAGGLRYWIQGKADPSSPAAVRDTEQGRHIEQAGWSIDTSGHVDAGSFGPLPKRIEATRATVTVTIVVTDWQWQ
ncbi:lipoprotein insertase outer membrane protein LolB [Silvimonas sp. JCM 19000]